MENDMPKVLITTVPFAQRDKLPIKLLEQAGVEFAINPLGRKLREDELAEMIGDYEVLIAGTEAITSKVIARAKRLKLISRVGVGLDSVDLLAAKQAGILVSYTPDAPAPAVAELTIGFIFSLLRNIQSANMQMHRGEWNRYFGRRITDVVVGVIGAGRIGERVLETLVPLNPRKILVNDLRGDVVLMNKFPNVKFVEKSEIFRDADLLTLHIPLTDITKDMIRYEHLKSMKSDAMIINTSRGGIINEHDLIRALREGHLSGAAIDVFEQEPYIGELIEIERCLLTSHMGSMSIDCRTRMEIEATEEAVRYFRGEMLMALVPQSEYAVRKVIL
jgi:D-3-phosphoglycerate dehydrogenase